MKARDFPILGLAFFSQSLIFVDSTTNFIVFAVLGVPWMTRNLSKLFPGIMLKAGINKSSAKVQFSSKNDALGPPKRHPKLQQS